tara:strand:+ start:1731 stop:2606 length:876 start_codon:yes stop_codon:yes gene_type:complete
MEKNQIVLLKERGLISISGTDATDFLQNIITNDIHKVSQENSVYSGIFTPQGKFLFEFFIIKHNKGFYIECDMEILPELIIYFQKYKLNSNLSIDDISPKFIIGVISNEKFEMTKKTLNKVCHTIFFENIIYYKDTRSQKLGSRLIIPLRNLFFFIKKQGFKEIDQNDYFKLAHEAGVPIKGVKKLQNKVFGLEANFEEYQGVDFKKGCFIGQENTARMKLRGKVGKKIMALKSDIPLTIGSELIFNEKKIGEVVLDKPFSFGLIKIKEIDFNLIKNYEFSVNKSKVKIIC